MDSSYFGEEIRGRKGKKSSNSEKPKQPQRGLGVAQLEKIRLHGLSSSSSTSSSSYQYPSHSHSHLHAHPYPTFNFNNLEDIRVQTSTYSSTPSPSSCSSSTSYGFNNNIMMGLDEYERTNNIRYGDSQPTTLPPRWDISGNAILENQYNLAQPSLTRHPLNLHDSDHEEMMSGIKNHRSNSSMGYNSKNSESSDNEELDLELRLSL